MGCVLPLETPVAPSRICLGTAGFGTRIPRAESFALLDAFLEAGGNFLDSAYNYACWIEGGEGASEKTIGAWLKARGCRDRVIVATKGGHPTMDRLEKGRCDRANLTRHLTTSLDRLGVACIDLYWLHRDEAERPVGEIMDTLAEFRRQGLIRHYGASNWTVARLEASHAWCDAHELPRFVASQPGWALAEECSGKPSPSLMVYMHEPLRQWHLRSGMAVVPYSAQAGGYFCDANAAWVEEGCQGAPPKAAHYDCAGNRARLRAAVRLARERGVSAGRIALAYLMNQPFPVHPIIGTSRTEGLREALAAASLPLTEDECALLRQGDGLE